MVKGRIHCLVFFDTDADPETVLTVIDAARDVLDASPLAFERMGAANGDPASYTDDVDGMHSVELCYAPELETDRAES